MAGDLFRRMGGGLGGLRRVAALLALFPAPLRAEDPAAGYAILLATSVKEDGIDYGALAEGRAALDAYVRGLAAAEPGATDPDRIAFWINAFNALALQEAIDGKREPDARSWKVAGRDVTLKGIEGILEEFEEPLVRFALHRAARSSPPLSAVLYEGKGLPAALLQQARSYLGDAKQNLFEYAQLRAELSMLFLRHREEFEAGRTGDVPPLQLFLADHLPQDKEEQAAIARSLRTTRWDISYRPFDGSLDEAGGTGPRAHPAWIVLYGVVAAALLFFGFRAFRALLRPPAPVPPHPPDG